VCVCLLVDETLLGGLWCAEPLSVNITCIVQITVQRKAVCLLYFVDLGSMSEITELFCVILMFVWPCIVDSM
jgi:hypothetical protein